MNRYLRHLTYNLSVSGKEINFSISQQSAQATKLAQTGGGFTASNDVRVRSVHEPQLFRSYSSGKLDTIFLRGIITAQNDKVATLEVAFPGHVVEGIDKALHEFDDAVSAANPPETFYLLDTYQNEIVATYGDMVLVKDELEEIRDDNDGEIDLEDYVVLSDLKGKVDLPTLSEWVDEDEEEDDDGDEPAATFRTDRYLWTT